MSRRKLLLVAHFGEDYIAYRSKFLSFLKEREVEVHAMVPKDKYQPEVEKQGHPVTFYKYQRSALAVFYFATFYRQLKKQIKAGGFDLVYTLKFFPNLIGIMAAKAVPGVKAAGTIAGLGFLDKQDRNFLIRQIFRVYTKVLNRADYVIIQNKDDLALLKPYLPKPKLVLTYGSGVDQSRFENFTFDDQKDRERLKLPQRPYLLLCSRIVREKGVKELVEGYLQAAKETRLDFDLVIAGWYDDAGLERELQQLVEPNAAIHLLGYQSDVRYIVSIAEAVVLPSYYPEGVPRSLTESLAMRKPIITTDHKGCRETCVDGVNGFLVAPKSAKALKEALLNYNQLSDEAKQAMAKESRALFDQKFEQKQVFKSIVEALNL